jgi:hypothetical protein
VTDVDNANYRDFTKKREPVHFGLNGQDFDCRKALTPRQLQLAMTAFKQVKRDFDRVAGSAANEDGVPPELLQKVSDVLAHFVKAESFARLSAMLAEEEPEEPIDIQQLMEILQWLLEKMAARPTTPSPDSTDTSPSDGTGTALTAGAPPAA